MVDRTTLDVAKQRLEGLRDEVFHAAQSGSPELLRTAVDKAIEQALWIGRQEPECAWMCSEIRTLRPERLERIRSAVTAELVQAQSA